MKIKVPVECSYLEAQPVPINPKGAPRQAVKPEWAESEWFQTWLRLARRQDERSGTEALATITSR